LFPKFILVETNSSTCTSLIPSVETHHLPHSASHFDPCIWLICW